jgi:hypothetical protein
MALSAADLQVMLYSVQSCHVLDAFDRRDTSLKELQIPFRRWGLFLP